MGYLNKVMLIGKLGQDPELRTTQSGNTVVSISLATAEKFTDKSGNKQERTEWHKLKFWNKQADLVNQYCKKGSQIYVEGSLQTSDWQDKDGNKRYTTEIIVRSMQFLDSKPDQGSQQNQGYHQNQQQGNQSNQNQNNQGHQQQPPNNDFIDDDIPF